MQNLTKPSNTTIKWEYNTSRKQREVFCVSGIFLNLGILKEYNINFALRGANNARKLLEIKKPAEIILQVPLFSC